ncbi:PD-(D/E)XK nuclease family protein [Bradyrhizobium liaoningense]|uniref:PD-(D/E)XK nuclease family protein n=1 Tax=Bradyrhizobium liaoningense TaxID=43992 RepID=UPI001BA53576|nr:PD-(D/E)XK nuclease family protein [Bradyrhizobium liaoningense]MBR0839114.1 PD-(D/E)XK nuclease family protein [Bradyrhizobium liaoningense]
MFSLYSNLFKYRESGLRSPREDYLSECLADFFNRLPLSLQSTFAARIFFPESLLMEFASVVADVTSLRLETQRQIASGRIDLVLLADDVPVAAIENKIAAQFQDDQLASYGRWIKKSGALSHRLAVVCLLTHLTAPPPEFMRGGEASGKATPHLVRWSSIAAILSELAVSVDTHDDIKLLARELRRFLEENDMSTEYAGRDEFAAALVYLRAGAQMDHTFGTIFAHVKEKDGVFAKNETKNEYHLKFDTPYKLIWGWTYLSAKVDGVLLGYGISLEPNSVFMSGGISSQASIPAADSVFICVGADSKRSIQAVRAAKNGPEKPWTYAEIGKWVAVISFRPLHDIMEKPESFAQEMIRWIDREAENINEFVAALR